MGTLASQVISANDSIEEQGAQFQQAEHAAALITQRNERTYNIAFWIIVLAFIALLTYNKIKKSAFIPYFTKWRYKSLIIAGFIGLMLGIKIALPPWAVFPDPWHNFFYMSNGPGAMSVALTAFFYPFFALTGAQYGFPPYNYPAWMSPSYMILLLIISIIFYALVIGFIIGAFVDSCVRIYKKK